MHEASDIAFDAGVPLIISHHKCAGTVQLGTHGGNAAADRSRWPSARTSPMDVYPYVAGSTVLREDLVDESSTLW
jgi:N-acyl-D-amino-acid deacylase